MKTKPEFDPGFYPYTGFKPEDGPRQDPFWVWGPYFNLGGGGPISPAQDPLPGKSED